MDLSKALRSWYLKYKRDLPWRETTDPYRIWISEVILQQTRVQQGLSYYHRFLEHFPDLPSLARAHPDEVMKVWKGLGYYSRARNMHQAAREIMKVHGGAFPATYREILRLKGIGPYTAAAIASFAFREAEPVVDGNVFRVLSRYFAIVFPPDSTEGKKKIAALARRIMDPENPDLHNQAIMEFGALQCVPQNPDCKSCPLRNTCQAYARDLVEGLPLKSRKPVLQNRYFNYVLVTDGKQMLVRKREGKDIWNGLYEFPLFESPEQLRPGDLPTTSWWKELEKTTGSLEMVNVTGIIRHSLTHRTIRAVFYHARPVHGMICQDGSFDMVELRQWQNIPFPRLIERFLDAYLGSNLLTGT